MSTKKSKSIVIHDFIMENFENGEAFRFDVLSGKTQLKTVSSNVNDNYLCPQTTQTTQKLLYLFVFVIWLLMNKFLSIQPN